VGGFTCDTFGYIMVVVVPLLSHRTPRRGAGLDR
jgi:hypothetical protein